MWMGIGCASAHDQRESSAPLIAEVPYELAINICSSKAARALILRAGTAEMSGR